MAGRQVDVVFIVGSGKVLPRTLVNGNKKEILAVEIKVEANALNLIYLTGLFQLGVRNCYPELLLFGVKLSYLDLLLFGVVLPGTTMLLKVKMPYLWNSCCWE